MAFNKDLTPAVDSSYGLVFRLNKLWDDVDRAFKSGNLDNVNFTLDRIFSNLVYRESLYIDFDKDTGEIYDISLDEKHQKIKDYIDNKLKEIKTQENNFARAGNKKEVNKAKGQYYKILMLKDAWLRKFNYELKLYLKESVNDPGTAMFGAMPTGKRR